MGEKLEPNSIPKIEQTEKNVIQPFPFKGGFEQKKITGDGERIPLTDERRERLNEMITEITKMFEGSDIKWSIDGGLSISLLRGEFIGEHRDLDLAVENSQLEQLQILIESKGYGLFITTGTQSRETMKMKRVNWKEFSEAETHFFWIIAVDKEGLIQKDKPLSFINVHIIRRNEQGCPVSETDKVLPSEWFELKTIQFQGKTINVAHPAKTAYYKMLSFRNYDIRDLQHLAGTRQLSLEDMDVIDSTLQKEVRARESEFYPLRKEVINKMKNWIAK